MDDDFAVRIDAANGFLRGLGLRAAHVGVRVQNLALQVGKIHRVEIHDADFADAGGGQIHGDGRAKTARADAQHARGFDFLLPGQTDFRQNQVPGVTPDFFVVQFHKSSGTQYGRCRINQVAALTGGGLICGRSAGFSPLQGSFARIR